MIMAENVVNVSEDLKGAPVAGAGSVGLETQVAGNPATVSAAALATGGVSAGNFIATDIDQELFRFNSDDTPLMQLMLSAKKVQVNSPVVQHYMLDEAKSCVITSAQVAGGSTSATLKLEAKDQNLLRPYTTLIAKGVDGYEGNEQTPGKDLMLFVTGHTAEGEPVVRAMNGQKSSDSEELGTIPAIPAGTTLVILANALYETQKQVDPDLIVPKPEEVYLQKRGMNQVVSDYFDAQKKQIPFTKAIIAEQAIANFKVRGNRTMWISRKGKLQVNVPNMGMQTVYSTEGVRWQFKCELQTEGKWTIEKLIALAKMFFTGEDVPKTAILLAGKNLLESLQCIDYSKHPEIQVTQKTNAIGWSVTNIHTVFGDIEVKREPTLDRIGYSNSGALIGEGRLVHYVYSQEHSFNDRVEGEEASRNGIIIWDGLALKGSCHIWIDGEGEKNDNVNVTNINYLEEALTADNAKDGEVYYLLADVKVGDINGKIGEMYKYDGSKFVEYTGEVYNK